MRGIKTNCVWLSIFEEVSRRKPINENNNDTDVQVKLNITNMSCCESCQLLTNSNNNNVIVDEMSNILYNFLPNFLKTKVQENFKTMCQLSKFKIMSNTLKFLKIIII